jgi:hypothetical protein
LVNNGVDTMAMNKEIFTLFNLANDELINRLYNYAYGSNTMPMFDSRSV